MCSLRGVRRTDATVRTPTASSTITSTQVILKPSPPDLQDLYLGSLEAIGIDPALHDLRFVEDDWESPTLGAWGLGWECWCDGMEVSQFTYFQQVAGFDCAPVSASSPMAWNGSRYAVQGVDNVYKLNFNGREGTRRSPMETCFCRRSRNIRASTSSSQTRRC